MAGAWGWRCHAQATLRVDKMTVEAAQTLPIETNTMQTGTDADTQRGSRFGIKAKLFLAFLFLASLTAVASAVAWYAFRDIERAVTRVSLESLPDTINALTSAEKSVEIAAAAPELMTVGSQEERVLAACRCDVGQMACGAEWTGASP